MIGTGAVKADIEADQLTLKQSDSWKHLIYWVIRLSAFLQSNRSDHFHIPQ